MNWQEESNNVYIDCELQLAIHKGGDELLLIIPGVDGSLNGYENKYLEIAKDANDMKDMSVVRMSNPFITSQHWESNVRQVLDYIDMNLSPRSISVFAHSAGASTIASIAHEYSNIEKLLLVNMPIKISSLDVFAGLNAFNKATTIVYGSEDELLEQFKEAKEQITTEHALEIIEGADHYFSDKHLDTFIKLPIQYLY